MMRKIALYCFVLIRQLSRELSANAVVAAVTSKSPTFQWKSKSNCTFASGAWLIYRPFPHEGNYCRNLKHFSVSYKLVSIGLCSNLNGQIMTDLMVAPPKPGDASYPLYQQEVTGIFSSLKRRAAKVRDIHSSFAPACSLTLFSDLDFIFAHPIFCSFLLP
jgi:hypothetical protein